jgi:type II secretory ATPase GspE/PulE/Tfp pilus assembly ATPase PilB-like protein
VLSVAAEAAQRNVFVVSTPGALAGASYAELALRLYKEKYCVTETFTADKAVLSVLLSEWTNGIGGTTQVDPDGGKSDLHELWDQILAQAHALGASDIHLFASLGRCDIKYRIHGDLEPSGRTFTQEYGIRLVSSMFNTMVDKGSTHKDFNYRKPASGSVTRQVGSSRLRLRFESNSLEPDGVKVTLRLINIGVTARRQKPSEMGYSVDQEEQLNRMFGRSSGMILFVGTTGSGKTTSLATLGQEWVINNPSLLLHTVEEPVEIRIQGAAQMAVTRDGTKPFATALSSLLRSDPDALLIGEIRDTETASLAVQAVRTGHLTLSTLHADGPHIAFDRLEGEGIKRGDLASVGLIIGVVHQRLVPTLCGKCKIKAARVDADEHRELLARLATYIYEHRPDLKETYLEHVHFRNPKGCPDCRRGVNGRTACASILMPKKNMLQAIRDGDSLGLVEKWRATIDRSRPDCMTGRTASEHARWKMTVGLLSPVDVERAFEFLDEDVLDD